MDGNQIKKISTRDITLIAILSAILFIQEELLTFIPNVQLTVFLLVLYSKKIGFCKTTIIIFIHVILDNFVMNSLNLFFTPTMFIGWMFIPLLVCSFGKKTENPFFLGCIALICSFLYCWAYIIPNYFFLKINPFVYLNSDIVFELILAVVGFITTFLLYKPCSKIFEYFNICKI